LAEKRGAEWNLSKTAALHTIIQAESSKKTFERHGLAMKGTTKGSIKNLTIAVPKYGYTKKDKEEQEWSTVTDDETMYALLLRCNAQQLLRSSQCPFATGLINDACRIDGNTSFAEEILEGTINHGLIKQMAGKYADVSQELSIFIKAMTRPRNSIGTLYPDFQWSFGVKEYKKHFGKQEKVLHVAPLALT
jgi:hypothetical protein